ncbi:MAG: hypothetical protein ACP5O6_13295, partial [Candidatus Baltobacteraceae bacterium]
KTCSTNTILASFFNFVCMHGASSDSHKISSQTDAGTGHQLPFQLCGGIDHSQESTAGQNLQLVIHIYSDHFP